MKNVRIFYTKTDRMKFVSHLDMNRLIPRMIRKAKLPVWYTEGFNRHIYINYAVPLSLGFEGEYEVMDIRLTEDDFPLEEVIHRLNEATVPGIVFLKAAEPVKPTKDIVFAEYELTFESGKESLTQEVAAFLKSDSVLCSKKGKKGKIREFDLIPLIKSAEVSGDVLRLVLTAGNENNLNPTLVLSTFFENSGKEPVFYRVRRKMLFDAEFQPFF